MPIEGTVCNGPASPLEMGETEFVWWQWQTQSAKACSVCKQRSGKLSPVKLPKPHAFCTCDQLIQLRTCVVGASVSLGTTSETIRIFARMVPPRTTVSFQHIGFNSTAIGSPPAPEDDVKTTVVNARDTPLSVYELWQVSTETRSDQYFCDTFPSETIEVTCTTSHFIGYQLGEE